MQLNNRKSYEAPRLTVLGKISDLTLGAFSMGNSDLDMVTMAAPP